MKRLLFIIPILYFSFLGEIASAQDKQLNLPPVAFFTFAGPITVDTFVSIKYVLMLHSIEVDRIQIIDANSGAVLIDDVNPLLTNSQNKFKSDPSIQIKQWEKYSEVEEITDTSPAWVHEKSNTNLLLEARLFKSGNMIFSTKQEVTYSYKMKEMAIVAVAHNRSLKKPE